MSPRRTTDEERDLFRSAFAEARPLKAPRHAANASKPAAGTNPRHTKKPSGIDGATADRLRRGSIEPEARLDLHGLTEAAAHRRLAAFLRANAQGGARLVLIVTGKGTRRREPDAPFDMELETRARGVLKTMVPRWLAEPDLGPLIADIRTAHRKHGGEGALYVYLRKAGK